MSNFQEKKISGLTVKIDRDTCIGTGSCSTIAPEVFELDDRQIITFTQDSPDIDRERLVEACQVCPVEALFAIDEKGEQLAP